VVLRNSETGAERTAVASSMVRLSWALTILGIQQAAHLVEGRRGSMNESGGRASRPTATTPVDCVLNAVEEQLGGVFRGLYRVGRECLAGVSERHSE
jgi:hypothetical protein